MSNDPTLLGYVESVTGATASVHLIKSVDSGLAIIEGTTYKVGQVGSFVRIPLGYQDLFGVVSGVGAAALPETLVGRESDTGRWMKIELVGEAIGGEFERGLSQHPSVNDPVHLVTIGNLEQIYGSTQEGQVPIGHLSSAESLEVCVELDKLVTRHSAIVGSTGSGKSTTIATLLRALVSVEEGKTASYANARVLLIDIHGEYVEALGDVASVYRINPSKNERDLVVPFWALDAAELTSFLTGGVDDDRALHIYDKITALRRASLTAGEYPGATEESLTVDTPIPFSLHRLWYDLINTELMTLEGPNRDEPALIAEGDAATLQEPNYKPHAMGAAGPFLNTAAPGIRRQLVTLKSRLLDRQYDFLLHPGDWKPDVNGKTKKDLPELLQDWLGHEHPITILDLSGVPSDVQIRLVGSILRILYEALFWSRDKSEGGRERPLLVVMEEAHRYLGSKSEHVAKNMVQRIVKEGRKYGIGAMIVSQRPSEVDETILSQCGRFLPFACLIRQIVRT